MIYHYRQHTRGSRQNNNDYQWKKYIDLDKSRDYSHRLHQFDFYNWVENPTKK